MSPWDKGARLAQLVAGRRTLLVLDGLEPLQHPPGPLAGELKDPGVTALLKGLAGRNAGLCVVTTRERVKDLAAFEESTVRCRELERLSTPAGVALLDSLGVHGPAADLERLVEDVRGHALTLTLLGGYLRGAHGGDVRRRDLVGFEEADAAIQGGHAFRVMAAYEQWLVPEESLLEKASGRPKPAAPPGGPEGRRQLAVLRLLGLFDRPAAADLLAVLRRPPAIPGLTDAIAGLGDAAWNLAVTRLAACGLVVPGEGGALDAHPLVREHFGRRLREGNPAAWKAAHGRLFDHLKETTEHRPDTLEGLQPLYQAVVHGCQAGRQQEACDEVYRDRILRGTGSDGFYSIEEARRVRRRPGRRRLLLRPAVEPRLAGALGGRPGLAAERGRLPPPRPGPADRGPRADAGRAADGGRPGGSGSTAAIRASNLSELELTLGDVAGAVRDAEQSVTFADRSGDAFQRMGNRTTLGDALHQAGRREEALSASARPRRCRPSGSPSTRCSTRSRASSTATCSSPAPSARPEGGRRTAAPGRLATRSSGGRRRR